jgi:hypothetical protein
MFEKHLETIDINDWIIILVNRMKQW